MATENQLTNKPNKIAKAYKAAHLFVADKSNIISPLTDVIPNPETTQNETLQVSQQIYGIGSKLLLSNPITSWIGLGMIGSQKANLNTIATDFNDDFGNNNNLSFLENTGNLLGSLTPFGKLLGTEINPVDKSRLAGSSMYNWYSDFDKYNNNNKPFSVWFGGDKLRNESANQQLKVDTAVGIRDEGARAMKFDPYRVAKLTDNQLRHAFDPRYNLGPSGKNGMKLQFAKKTISKHNIKKHLIAKHGTVLQFSEKTLGSRKFKKGGQTTKLSDLDYVKHLPDGNVEIYLLRDPTYEEWVKDIPKEYLSELYDLRLAYELLDKDLLDSWKYAVTSDDPDFFMNVEWPVLDDDGNPVYNDDGKIETYSPYHLGSIAPELDKNGEWTGNYVFLKLGKEDLNPELHWETDIYKSGKGEINPATHELKFIPEKNRYYYIAIDPDKFKQLFKSGGKVNVIPSGALHAHKHNLTKVAEDGEKFEDVTTKGIPVVVEDEKGNLIQQAEVEREEIIFRLEVTKKLEELMKKGTDEAAIEAGKLLAHEIVENTLDNTNIMI